MMQPTRDSRPRQAVGNHVCKRGKSVGGRYRIGAMEARYITDPRGYISLFFPCATSFNMQVLTKAASVLNRDECQEHTSGGILKAHRAFKAARPAHASSFAVRSGEINALDWRSAKIICAAAARIRGVGVWPE